MSRWTRTFNEFRGGTKSRSRRYGVNMEGHDISRDITSMKKRLYILFLIQILGAPFSHIESYVDYTKYLSRNVEELVKGTRSIWTK